MDDVLNRKSKGFVWLDYFTEHQNIEKLTREVVVSLIREIKVFDKNHIEVIFDFFLYELHTDNRHRFFHRLLRFFLP